MKNPDEAIERVLAGLREAEVPAGMEARILGAMAARAGTKQPERGWNDWMVGRGYGWRLSGAAAVAGVCLLAVIGVATRNAGHVASHGRSVDVVSASGGLRGAKEIVPQRLKPHNRSGGHGTAEAVPVSKTADPSSEAEGDVDYDLRAVSEMLAPSKPAPPLPLTRQERLLAQVVHHGDREELAELRPEVRAKQVEIAKTEFHNFFEPLRPTKDNEESERALQTKER